jgi:hypothetical protein
VRSVTRPLHCCVPEIYKRPAVLSRLWRSAQRQTGRVLEADGTQTGVHRREVGIEGKEKCGGGEGETGRGISRS